MKGTASPEILFDPAKLDQTKLAELDAAVFSDDERKLHQTLLSSLKFVKYKDLAMDTVNYIIRIYNSDSFGAIVDPIPYEELLWKAVDGLFGLVYLSDKYFDPDEYEIVEKDELFQSAMCLIVYLSRRSYKGADYQLKKIELMAKQPITIRGVD